LAHETNSITLRFGAGLAWSVRQVPVTRAKVRYQVPRAPPGPLITERFSGHQGQNAQSESDASQKSFKVWTLPGKTPPGTDGNQIGRPTRACPPALGSSPLHNIIEQGGPASRAHSVGAAKPGWRAVRFHFRPFQVAFSSFEPPPPPPLRLRIASDRGTRQSNTDIIFESASQLIRREPILCLLPPTACSSLFPPIAQSPHR
jgi:hypothetical protein